LINVRFCRVKANDINVSACEIKVTNKESRRLDVTYLVSFKAEESGFAKNDRMETTHPQKFSVKKECVIFD